MHAFAGCEPAFLVLAIDGGFSAALSDLVFGLLELERLLAERVELRGGGDRGHGARVEAHGRRDPEIAGADAAGGAGRVVLILGAEGAKLS